MKTRGAILRQPGKYEVENLVLDEPIEDEIQVEMVASGLCHSDDHFATGDLPFDGFPFCGGHEGAGVVQKVGPNTRGWDIGDHVVFTFLPICGRCKWCATGHQNLCDEGAHAMQGVRSDGTSRLHLEDGTNVGQMLGISTFATHTTVHVNSAVKVDKDLPLERLCLLGCAVGTGWGSAVNSAEVRPNDTVIVMGVGGVGINAVQGAAHAGAAFVIAVDPVAFKREQAFLFGATHAFADISEASAFAKSVTNGQGADSAIVTIGVVHGEHVAQAFEAIRKAGTVVVSGVTPVSDFGIPVSLFELTLYQKRIQGSVFGACNPTSDIPRQVAMYRDGKIRLDELVTREYDLDEVAQGFEDMHAGVNIRGVIRY
jgi:S-(hydroxymethyl)glutathione dehydrogenase/alcohol dehydrogenase